MTLQVVKTPDSLQGKAPPTFTYTSTRTDLQLYKREYSLIQELKPISLAQSTTSTIVYIH